MTHVSTTQSKRDLLFLFLGGIFVTNAVLAELIGGKLIQVGPFAMSIGVLPWPVVFLTTDLINEYFGRDGVKKLTLMTLGLISYAFLILFLAIQIPAASFSPVQDAPFSTVFGQSLWIIVGSLTAFTLSQFVDVSIFWLFRNKTQGRFLWLRATGSTAVSQLVDTFVIMGIAFWLPGKISTGDYIHLSCTNYIYKFGIAVALTPLIYGAHTMIDRFLGEQMAHDMIEKAVEEELS